MEDNITIEKCWQDNELILLEVVCSSCLATAKAKIYVCDESIDELIDQIRSFLNFKIKECVWESGDKGNDSTTCVAFRFFTKDKSGHILVEAFAEIDDGGTYDTHNCCFYINTEHGFLMDFCRKLDNLKNSNAGTKIVLNDI